MDDTPPDDAAAHAIDPSGLLLGVVAVAVTMLLGAGDHRVRLAGAVGGAAGVPVVAARPSCSDSIADIGTLLAATLATALVARPVVRLLPEANAEWKARQRARAVQTRKR